MPPGLSLLDLGAGPGYLGAAIRGQFGHLTGVEADPTAAADAGKLYDRWITAPLSPGLAFDRTFDVIVCADILEHLASPESLLPAVGGWLAPGGLLLVSLPNVANITLRFSLLAGRFTYADRGLLDRTHLRFFTRRTGREMIESSGFRVERIESTAMPVELAIPLLGKRPIRPVARGLFAAAAAAWPTLFGYQFLFEARRQ